MTRLLLVFAQCLAVAFCSKSLEAISEAGGAGTFETNVITSRNTFDDNFPPAFFGVGSKPTTLVDIDEAGVNKQKTAEPAVVVKPTIIDDEDSEQKDEQEVGLSIDSVASIWQQPGDIGPHVVLKAPLPNPHGLEETQLIQLQQSWTGTSSTPSVLPPLIVETQPSLSQINNETKPVVMRPNPRRQYYLTNRSRSSGNYRPSAKQSYQQRPQQQPQYPGGAQQWQGSAGQGGRPSMTQQRQQMSSYGNSNPSSYRGYPAAANGGYPQQGGSPPSSSRGGYYSSNRNPGSSPNLYQQSQQRNPAQKVSQYPQQQQQRQQQYGASNYFQASGQRAPARRVGREKRPSIVPLVRPAAVRPYPYVRLIV